MYLFRTDDQEQGKAEDNASETQKADYIRLALEVSHVRYRYDIADSNKILKQPFEDLTYRERLLVNDLLVRRQTNESQMLVVEDLRRENEAPNAYQ